MLSQVINAGFEKNFNDYINAYRVEAVKVQLQAGAQVQKSLLGIALDCGFNSKATFTIWNFEMNWKKMLKNAFRAFDKAGSDQLIIDIRGNEGGANEVLAVLQKYILKEDCTVEDLRTGRDGQLERLVSSLQEIGN